MLHVAILFLVYLTQIEVDLQLHDGSAIMSANVFWLWYIYYWQLSSASNWYYEIMAKIQRQLN